MSPGQFADRVARWLDAPPGASLTSVWAIDDDASLEGAFRRFYADLLQYGRVNAGESLRAVRRFDRRERATLPVAVRTAALRLEANMLSAVGDVTAASQTYERAWNAFEEQGLHSEMVATGMGWSHVLTLLGETEQALAVLQRSMQLLRPDESLRRARLRVHLGSLYQSRGEIDLALREMKAGAQALRRAGLEADAALAEANIGQAQLFHGRPHLARPHLESSLASFRRAGMRIQELVSELSLVCLEAIEGRLEGVDERLDDLVRRFMEIGDRRSVAGTLLDHARILAAVGARDRAIVVGRSARDLFTELGVERERAYICHLLARLHIGRGELADARRELGTAMRWYGQWKASRSLQLACLERASIELADGNATAAARSLRHCRRAVFARPTIEPAVRWLSLRAQVDLALGRPRAALKRSTEAHRRAQRPPISWERPWIALTAARSALALSESRGRISRDERKRLRQRAFEWAQRAVRSLELLDLALGARAVRDAIAPTREDLTRGAMEVAMRVGGPSAERRALDFLSRARSVQLVEDLLRGDELEESLRASILQLRDRLYQGEESTSESRVHHLRVELQELDAHLTRVRASSPALVRDALRARSFAGWARQLDGRPAVLYDLESDEPVAWVARSARNVTRVPLPDARTAIRDTWTPARMLLDYLAHLPTDERESMLDESATETLDALVAVRRALWDPLDLPAGEVILVPTETLQEVPVEASLATNDTEWSVTRLPHPALLRSTRGGKRRARALVLHDGARGDRGELKDVTRLLRKHGLEVRRAHRRHELATHEKPLGVLHVAAHGAFDRRRWVGNGIRLADGWIGFEQLRRRMVRDSLLFFSSCESALPLGTPTAALDGWMTAGLGAGAREMILTLWKIDDRAARSFAERFYPHWCQGDGAAGAAQRARRELAQAGEHPFRWAPFVAIG